MANLLSNMLTLQTEHRIPMQMDIAVPALISYYNSFKSIENSIEKERLIDQVLADLRQKLENTDLTI